MLTINYDGKDYSLSDDGTWIESGSDSPVDHEVSSKLETIAIDSGVTAVALDPSKETLVVKNTTASEPSGLNLKKKISNRTRSQKKNKIKIFDN